MSPADGDKPLPLATHIGELRKRASISAGAFLVATIVSLFFASKLFWLLAEPLNRTLPAGSSFVALTPFEVWSVYFKLASVAGLILSSPVWAGQLMAFLRPATSPDIRKKIYLYGFISGLFFATGVLFCCMAVLPAAFEWSNALTLRMGIKMMPRVLDYVSLTLSLSVAFGIAFELPVFVAALIRTGIVPADKFKNARPYVIVAAFVIGAVLTPPDVMSQIGLSLVLILLYEAGIVLGCLSLRQLSDSEKCGF